MNGDFIQWAEGETGGEAFIPIADVLNPVKFSDEWCRQRRKVIGKDVPMPKVKLPIRRWDAFKAFFRAHL